ncbi:MAG: amidohydrolase family protein [Christensenellaceae bacterium]
MITILKGDVAWSRRKNEILTRENAYLVADEGKIVGVFSSLPQRYAALPVADYTGKLIIPGMVDLHTHASQYAYRGTGMDLELLDWLDRYAFHEEGKFSDPAYARLAYGIFAQAIKESATTRVCAFATRHAEATLILMDEMEKSGVVSYIGKVNMDRNAPDPLREPSPAAAKEETIYWLEESLARHYVRTKPILTPRFIPSCTDELMEILSLLRSRYDVAIQSHLSENPSEIRFVRELRPSDPFYGAAYDRYGLFGTDHATGKPVPTLMAHCIYSGEEEIALMKRQGVFVVHCPSSNFNVTSGIAPVRRYLDEGLCIGLGSDVAGGESESMFHSVVDAIKASKMRERYVDPDAKGLSFEEGFYLATLGGGAFFGKVGSFEEGYAFDAVVLDDTSLRHPQPMTIRERLERAVYLGLDNRGICAKFVDGVQIL